MKRRTVMSFTIAAALVIGSAPLFAADKPVKIGVVLKTLSSEYWKTVAQGAKDAAKASKVKVELIVLGPPAENLIEQQINMLQDVLSQNPDALIFSPSQPATAGSVLAKFKDKKIPVLLVDTGMPEGFTDYLTFIGTDNYSAGKKGGEALAALVTQGDKVALLDGTPGNSAMNDRIKGANDVLLAKGVLVAANQPAYSDREKAYTVMQNILQANPDIKGVFAASDEQALGALRALQQSKKDAPVIGVDGNPDNLKSILSGGQTGTVAQGNYDMGRLAVEKALEAIDGKPVQKRIDSGATLITKANAQELLDFQKRIGK